MFLEKAVPSYYTYYGILRMLNLLNVIMTLVLLSARQNTCAGRNTVHSTPHPLPWAPVRLRVLRAWRRASAIGVPFKLSLRYIVR